MKLLQLDHITITSADPERSIAFYRDVLGLKPVYEWPGEITMLQSGDTFVAIAWWAKGKQDKEQPAVTVDHFAFRVDATTFEKAKSELPARGIPIDHISDHGINYSLYFRDPDGHMLELACYDVQGSQTKMPRSLL